jgi:hypothetical protein
VHEKLWHQAAEIKKQIIEAMAALNAGAPGAGRRDIVNVVAARTTMVASADRRLSLHGVVAVVGAMQPAMGVGVVAELFAARFGEPPSRVETEGVKIRRIRYGVLRRRRLGRRGGVIV